MYVHIHGPAAHEGPYKQQNIHSCIYTHLHVHTHRWILNIMTFKTAKHTYMYIHTPTCAYTSLDLNIMCTRTALGIHAYIRTHIYAYIQLDPEHHVHTHGPGHTCIRTHTYMHIYSWILNIMCTVTAPQLMRGLEQQNIHTYIRTHTCIHTAGS